MVVIRETAPAKINLTLHVTGQRDDGYHLLDSWVVFAGSQDLVTARTSNALSFSVEGPFSDGIPMDGNNLVLQAALALGGTIGANLLLEKNLPPASGIGGGSSDAAATLRALSKLWQCPLPNLETCLALGADVPVCMSPTSQRMQGIGEVLSPVGPIPTLWALLVNPRVEVATPHVFAAMQHKTNAAMQVPTSAFRSAVDIAQWLRQQRNDLEPPALLVQPQICDVLHRISKTSGCLLHRMSGSGATCFGLYGSLEDAERAAQSVKAEKPDWWCEATTLQ